MILSVELTEVEAKALSWSLNNMQEWFADFVQKRAGIAIQEIYDLEVARLKADPNTSSIPVNVDQVVLQAPIKSAAQAQAEMVMPVAPGL